MPSPLESRHIAPLYQRLCELGMLLPRGCASLTYSDTEGVLLHSSLFDCALDSKGRDFALRLGGGGEEVLALIKPRIPASSREPNSKKSKQASGQECAPRTPPVDSPARLDSRGIESKREGSTLATLALLAWKLKGWRKGPFTLVSPTQELCIDSEWQSQRKWNLLAPFARLRGARVADVGCNNGFYMLAMFAHAMAPSPSAQALANTSSNPPLELVGFDPSGLYYCQFQLLNHLLDLPITYELSGVEQLPTYTRRKKFDVIFCLGVLYHRSDVFSCLKSLAQSLERGGEAFIDTLIFDISDVLPHTAQAPESSSLAQLELVLSVPSTYARMSNVYLLPSLSALEGWCKRAGLGDIELLGVVPTTLQEQRKSAWIDSLSLESFLSPDDGSKTVEGYPAPKRAYIRVRRI